MLVTMSHWRVGVIISCLIVLGFAATGQGATTDEKGGDIPDGWRLMPRVGIGLEYGGFIVHQDNFTSMPRRRLEIDLLQYRRHIIYLDLDENTFFGIPDNKWQFNQMKYAIFAGYRYDFGNFYLGAFFHHQCNNLILTSTYSTWNDREITNFYGIGLEFLTKNMRLGMKDRGINFDSPQVFEFLGRWAGGFRASKLFPDERRNHVGWILKGQARYDIFRYCNVVPYVEVTGEVLVNPVTRVAPSAEFGARLHFTRFDLTPFFKWSRDQESIWPTGDTNPVLISKNSLYGGARVETLLDAKTFNANPDGIQFLPEIHGLADYALYLNSSLSKGRGEVQLNLEALRWNSWTAFLYSDMNFSSEEEDYKPDKINYWLQYGLTYSPGNYFVEGFVKNTRRLDSSISRQTMERSNLAGLRAGTKGMKPGHFNEGISFTSPATFEFINNWNAQASFGHFFNNRDWQYLWNVNAKIRWDPIRWHFIVPYIEGEMNWQSGGGPTRDTVDYTVEPGLRFHGVLDLALYYRFQHQENRLFFRGPSANESLIGLKALF